MTGYAFPDSFTARCLAAYERVLPEIDALPDEQLAVISIDVPQAVSVVLAAWPPATSLPPRAGNLQAYALALGHAHAVYVAASHRTCPAAARVLATSRRLRAFSLFMRAYEAARRDGAVVPALDCARTRRRRVRASASLATAF